MLTKALILCLLALTGTYAKCVCYTSAPLASGTKITLSNGYDDSNFNACYSAACGFVAYSGSATVGWSNINVQFSSSTDNTGKFQIYNGNTSDPNLLMNTYTVAKSGQNMSLTSSTPYIYIVYTQDDTSNPNSYFGTLTAGGGLAAPTTPAPTTPAPTTRPFNNPLYANDPWLISHDILVVVNQKTTQGAAGLTALNSLAGQFVDLLSITSSTTSESQSRLGLTTVTPYNPYYAAQGEIWSMNATDVKGALPQSGISINVDIVTALTNMVNTFFNVTDPVAPTRKNVQRSIILFTAWWGDNTQVLNQAVQDAFNAKGVNLVIVGFNTNSPQLINNDWYNYVSLTTTTDKDVAGFVNRFYLNSGLNNTLTNNWCKKVADPTQTPTTNFIKEPSNYGGPPMLSQNAWSSSFDGQKGRYCNFQDTTYTYTRSNSNTLVTVTVFYELEVGQDYLKFQADGVNVESFTGYDVNNASFDLDANVITARFTTDSSGVQRGFYVKFEETKDKPSS